MNAIGTGKVQDSTQKNKPSSAKKLVQARLPFKILTSSADSFEDSNKRKLSCPSEESEVTILKQVKFTENLCSQESEVVDILSENEYEDDEHNLSSDSEKMKGITTYNRNNPENSEQISRNFVKKNNLIIKLPLTNKKRKKSSFPNKIKTEENEISDPELLEKNLNPQKKLKICQLKSGYDLLLKEHDKTDHTIELDVKKNDKNEALREHKNTKNYILLNDEKNIKSLSAEEPEKFKTPNQTKDYERGILALEKYNKKKLDEQKRQEKEEIKRKEKEKKEEIRKKEKEEKDNLRLKEKEEKEDTRRKEKEEKEKKRLAENEIKNEEKKQKEEKREEEKRRKEIEKEEIENKKKKAAEAFTKFFHQKKTLTNKNTISQFPNFEMTNRAFMPFQVKGDMKLAPFTRKLLDETSKNNLNSYLRNNNCMELYLDCLKSKKHEPFITGHCKYIDSEDVIIIDELQEQGEAIRPANKLLYRAKYFHFEENRRPPFYGTWRKKSHLVAPRRPFSLDKQFFDYDVNSDDEWEEEEPGESLHGSDDEKESDDEYEVDNDFFVPHGHLSDEEMQNEDDIDSDNSPESQKAKLKILQLEFVNEMKKKTEKIKPRLIGVIWTDEFGLKPETCPDIIWESLNKRAMLNMNSKFVWERTDNILEIVSPLSPNRKIIKGTKLNDELVEDLIRLIHGNKHNKRFLIHEFQAYVTKKSGECLYSKSIIRNKIHEIAQWTVLYNNDVINKKKKLCWVVGNDILNKYNLNDLTTLNEWKYILPFQHILKTPIVETQNVVKDNFAKESLSKNNTFFKADSLSSDIFSPTSNLTNPLNSNSKNNKTEAGSLLNKKQKKCNELSDDLIKDLIRLVHGNRHKKQFIVYEFLAYIAKKTEKDKNIEYLKSTVRDKIEEIAQWTALKNNNTDNAKKKLCWIVKMDILIKYELKHITTLNEWKYILPFKSRLENSIVQIDSSVLNNVTYNKSVTDNEKNSIQKFKSEELNNRKIEMITSLTSGISKNSVPKKEDPSLISAARDQFVPKNKKNALINETNIDDADQKNSNKTANENCVICID